jgi:putative hydrolase
MIPNDLHVHSVKSPCGLHTVLEIVEIAVRKGMRSVNISDHGEASTRSRMNFSMLADRQRFPMECHSQCFQGSKVNVLAGIEGNILDDGSTDIPMFMVPKLDLVSAGFHSSAEALKKGRNPIANVNVLAAFLERCPIDILVHPCIMRFPLERGLTIDLAARHGFALEVNNTNLRVKKTDVQALRNMITEAVRLSIPLVANSDGHTYFEIGEDDKVVNLVGEMGLPMSIFLNYDDATLKKFLEQRKARRERWYKDR